jgi:hypothetical protein
MALWFVVREPAINPERQGVQWVYTPARDDIIRKPSKKDNPFAGTRTKVCIPRHVTSRIQVRGP